MSLETLKTYLDHYYFYFNNQQIKQQQTFMEQTFG